MWPEIVNGAAENGFAPFIAETYSLGALSDSTYEYLPKVGLSVLSPKFTSDNSQGHLMMGATSHMYSSMWAKARKVIIDDLLYRPMTPDGQDILFSASVTASNYTGVVRSPDAQHLACFQGGMFAIAAKVLEMPEDMDLAEMLTNGCVWAYEQTKTGIMPERFLAIPCEDPNHCPWDQKRWDEETNPEEKLPLGFAKVWDKRYLLRYAIPQTDHLIAHLNMHTY